MGSPLLGTFLTSEGPADPEGLPSAGHIWRKTAVACASGSSVALQIPVETSSPMQQQ